MVVPVGRESDWIFSTQRGHLQLLLNAPEISRLVLVGNVPEIDFMATYSRPECAERNCGEKLEEILKPLLLALSPDSSLESGFSEMPFLVYEDNVICSVALERCSGLRIGEMLVEDVEIECAGSEREFRRRLRFKRMPNLVQTEIRIVPELGSDPASVGEAKFRPDTGILVHPYLAPMVASLSLVGTCMEGCFGSGVRPRALCLGVGGGALLAFLKTQLGFEVVGVEEDEAVLGVARRYFGLVDDEFLRIVVGDGIEFLERTANKAMQNMGSVDACKEEHLCNLDNVDGLDTKYEVIMVDLDASDARNGISAPPMEFVRKSVLLAAKMVLCDLGILVINVVPLCRSFLEMLIHEFREVFLELYEIDVGNGENFVLIASASSIKTTFSDGENLFLKKLRMIISEKYMDSIRKI